MIIIGITGKKRHGKDLLARLVRENFQRNGFATHQLSMALALRKELVPFLQALLPGKTWEQTWAEINDDGKKEHYRSLMQWWGTDYRRRIYGQDYWTRRATEMVSELSKADGANPSVGTFADIRFPDEAAWVKSNPMHYLVRIERPSVISADPHRSETAMDDYPLEGYDSSIVNYDDPFALEKQATHIYNQISAIYLRPSKNA